MGALAPMTPWNPEDDLLLRNAVEVKAFNPPSVFFLCKIWFYFLSLLWRKTVYSFVAELLCICVFLKNQGIFFFCFYFSRSWSC
jgi:hypothetical protein